MSTLYPSEIDTSINLPDVTDLVTPVGAVTVNRLRDAIIAIETELGVDPAGVYSTLRARLDAIETSIQSGIARAGDIGGTYGNPLVVGLQGRPVSPTAPLEGQVLAWDGSAWAPTDDLVASTLTAGLVHGATVSTPLLNVSEKSVWEAIDSSLVSGADQGIIYFDNSENKYKVSENGGAYVDLVSYSDEILVGPTGSSAQYICDGVNDHVEINAAITEAATLGKKMRVRLLPGTYYVGAAIFLKSNVLLEGSGMGATKIEVVTGFSNSNYFVIGAYGAETTNVPMTLLSNVASGATTLTVATGAELNAIELDSYLFLATDALWSPEQVPNSNRKGGEFVKVRAVDTGTGVITVWGMVRGDYFTTDNAALYRMSLIQNTGVKDLEMYQQGALTTRTNAPVMIGLQKAQNVFIRDCHVYKSDGPALSFHAIIDGDIRNCNIHDLTDNTGSSQFGYGIVMSGACDNIVIANNKFSRMRHAITTGSINTPSPSNIILRGVQRGVLFSGNVASHCTNTVYDTHAESENFTIINNVASNSSGLGIFARNPSARIIANTVEYCQGGIKVGSNVFDVSSGQGTGSAIVANVIRNLRNIAPTNYCIGISLCLTEHCTVQGNVVSSCDGAGLELRFGAQFNHIKGNTFLNCNLANAGTTLADAIYLEGAYSGSAGSLSQAGTTTTATGLTNMSPSLVGKNIVITASANPANIGTFTITSYISASSVTWTNASGVTDAGGAVAWYIESVCDNIIEENTARNTGQALFEAGRDGAPGHMKWLVRIFGGTGQNVRNIVRNNIGIGMESGLVSAPAGNFIAGNTSNESHPVKNVAGVPADTSFATTALPGTMALDSSTGRMYFRTEAAATWGDVIHARGTSVTIPVTTIQYANSGGSNININQASTASGNGAAFLIAAQSTSAASQTGGVLYLNSGNSGAGGAESSIRLGIGSGNTGIQITPTLVGQSLYSVVATATSVRFQQSTTATASATGGTFTIQAQSASGTTSNGGALVLASGTGTAVDGSVRMAVGGDTMIEATEVAAGRRVVALARTTTISTTQLPASTGDGIVFIGTAATNPTANPVSGSILYSDSGILKVRNVDGLVAAVASDPAINGLRLSLTTNTPVITSDVASSSTLYLTPYTSGYISLYDNNSWVLRTTNEVSLALSGLTSGLNYDVFAYWTGSAVALELSPAWSTDTSRTPAFDLARQNGILVRSGTPTRRYVGTIRATGATTTADTVLQRYVYNYSNQTQRTLYVQDTTASWSYTGAAYRQVRATATNRVEAVFGQVTMVAGTAFLIWSQPTAGYGVALITGIGVDSTTVNVANPMSVLLWNDTTTGMPEEYWNPSMCMLDTLVASGYHAFNWLEAGYGSGSILGRGTAGNNIAYMRLRITM